MKRKYDHLAVENGVELDKNKKNLQSVSSFFADAVATERLRFDFQKGSIFVISGPAGVGKS